MKLVCRFSNDKYELKNSTIFDFDSKNDIKYTFWQQKNNYPSFYKNEAIDLLYLSLGIFAADRLFLRSNGEDAWSRKIDLYMPVLSIDVWDNCQSLVENMLNFLTGDKWRIHFRKRQLTEMEKKSKDKWKKCKKRNKNISKICMFSGGLDSCIGAINLLSDTSNTSEIMFVSHYGGGKGTIFYQNALKDEFINKFNLDKKNFIQNYAAVISGIENTTRSRSLMFFSHAVAYASAMGKEIELIIPENGLISLNIPLAYTRTGTSSTRTTHPYYMQMFQNLLCELGINVKIKNPFQYKTKGEMINTCKDKKFLQKILNKTMSCSHPDIGRYHHLKDTMHCGYCLPCTIRRAAILAGKLKDTSIYFDTNYKILPVAQQALRTYKYAMKNFDPNIAFLRIQESGPIGENVDQFTNLYIRGMKEMKSYLEYLNV